MKKIKQKNERIKKTIVSVLIIILLFLLAGFIFSVGIFLNDYFLKGNHASKSINKEKIFDDTVENFSLEHLSTTPVTDVNDQDIPPVVVKSILIGENQERKFLDYNRKNIEIVENRLRCIEDDRILQWHKGINKWDCVKPPEAIFGHISDSVEISSAGAMECNHDGEVIYWNDTGDYWDCGSVGNGLDVAMDDLSDADTTSTLPLNNQVLGWDGTNWVPMTATVNTDNQAIDTFSLAGDALILEIENDGVGPQIVDLSNFITNTESINELVDVDTSTVAPTNGQVLTWDNIQQQWIAGSASAGNTDNQQLGLNGVTNILTLSNGTGADTMADLSGYLDNTDAQLLAFNAGTNILSLTNGGTVNLSSLNDEYSAGNGLALSAGNVFSLNAGIDLLTDVDTSTTAPINNQVLTWNSITSNWEPATLQSVFSLWDNDHDTGIQVEENADEDYIRFDTAGNQRMEIDNNGNILFSDSEPADLTNPGTLQGLLYRDDKFALRVGETNGGNQWNDASVGQGTFASGEDNIVSGGYSSAFGGGNNIDDVYSVAMGRYNTVTSSYVVAGGYQNNASGYASSVFGQTNQVTSNRAMAWGLGNQVSGREATAWGRGTRATGAYATSWGRNTQANGPYATAFGQNSQASGTYATAFGRSTIAGGQYSTAFGNDTNATGLGSTSLGYRSTAGGQYSLATGYYSEASGNDSAAFNDSLANSYMMTAIGRFNENVAQSTNNWVDTEQLFVVGNGTGWQNANRHNAYTLLKNGYAGYGDSSPVAHLVIGDDANANYANGLGDVYIQNDLEVDGNLSVVGYYRDSSNDVGTIGQVLSSTVAGTDWVDLPTTSLALWDNDHDTGVQVEENADDDTFRVDTAGVERLYINQLGDFHIQNSLGNYVDLNGNSYSVNNDDRIYFHMDLGSNDMTLQTAYLELGDVEGEANDTQMVIDSNNSFFLLENGFVGMGTGGNPTQQLDVNGNTRLRGALYDVNNQPGTAGQILSSTVAGTDWIDASSLALGSINLHSDVDTSTTPPSNGDLLTWNGANWVTTSPTNYTDNIYTADGTLAGNRTVTMNGNNLYFTGIGNVGIGTVLPSQKLHVKTIANGGTNTPVAIFESNESEDAVIEFRGDTSGTEFFIGRHDFSDEDVLSIGRTGIAYDLVLNNNGDFGIGTTTPSQRLHINGNARLTGALYDVNNQPGTAGQILSSTVAGTDWIDASSLALGSINLHSDVDTATTPPSNGDLLTWNGANWVTTSPTNYTDNIYTADGTLAGNRTVTGNGNTLTFTDTQIGINRTATSHAFEIYGDDYDNVMGLYTDPGDGESAIQFFPENNLGMTIASGGVFLGSRIRVEGNQDFWINSNSTDRLFIEGSNGNIGLATNTPSQLLDVNGNTRLRGFLYDGNNQPGTAGQILSSTATGTDWVDASSMALGSIDLHSDVDTSTTAPTNNQVLTWDNANSQWVPADTQEHTGTTGSVFFANNTTGEPTEDNTNLFWDDGNNRLGIGTASPDYDLDVAGTIGVDDYIYHNGDSNTYTYFTPDRWQLFTGGRSMIDAQFSANEVAINEGSTQMDFRVEGGTEVNLLFTDGSTDRVGIATNAPSQLLDVVGNIELNDYLYFRNGNTQYLRHDGSTFIISDDFLPSGDDTSDLGSSSYRWQDLYLGPQTMHIGSNLTKEGLIGYDATNDILTIDTDATTQGDIAFNTDDLYIDTTNSRVGIGTTSPDYALQINGDVAPGSDLTFDMGKVALRWNNIYANNIVGNINPGLTPGSVTFISAGGGITEDNSHFFWNDGSDRLGIGTNSPSYNLDVRGNGYFSRDLVVQDSEIIYSEHSYEDSTLGYELIWNLLQTEKTNDPNDRDFATIASGTGWKQGFPITRWKVGDEATNGQHYGYVGYFPGDAWHPEFRVNTGGDDDTPLMLGTATRDVITIDWHQNVGINTTSPTDNLHIVGDMRLTGAFNDRNNQPGTAGQILSSTATGTDWVDASSMALGSINLHSDVDTTTTPPSSGDLLSWDGANWVTTSPTNYTDNIYTADGQLTGSRIVDLNNNNLIFDNAGIGTGELHVQNGLRWLELGSTGTVSYVGSAYGGPASNNHPLVLRVGDVEHLRVDTNGHVGIGETVPDAKLHVKTDENHIAKFEDTDVSSFMNIWSDWYGNDISITGQAVGSTGEFQIIGAYNDNIFIGADGNMVGINTDTPTQQLDVNGNTRLRGLLYDENNQSGTAGQILSSTATGTDWVDASSMALGSIDLHSDVDTSTTAPTNNQVLTWNGANWIPASISGLETTTNIANQIVGHKIADYTNEDGAIQDIYETITSLALNANSLDYTAENGIITNIDLSGYLDNTDDQNIQNLGLAGDILTVGIEDGTSQTVSLAQYALDTDLHDAVTLAGALDYITLAGQVLTLNTVDISDDTNLVAGTGLSLVGDTINLNAGIDLLTDVDTTTTAPTNNQVLTWDNANSQWVPADTQDHTGTTGSVFFAGASGTPDEDNANLFWDDGNDRLGIGTASPTMDLDVDGSARVRNVLRAGNWRHVLTDQLTGTASDGYLLTTSIPYDGSTNRGMHTIRIKGYSYGTAQSIDFVVNFYLYTVGSRIYNYGWTNFGAYDPGDVILSYEGNVLKLWWSNRVYYPSFEIFTTTHNNLTNTDSYFEGWDITDAVAPTTNLVNVTYRNAQPQGLTMGGNIELNSNWLSGDGGNEGIFVDSAGNVGIGTNSPSQELHVNGDARITGAIYDSNNQAGTAGQILSSTATGTDWIDAVASIWDGDGDTGIQVEETNDDDTIRFDLGTTAVDALLLTQSTGLVWNDNSSGTLDFRIEGNTEANLFFADASTDRIGIGTNSPDEELDVVGDIALDEYLYFENGTTEYLRFNSSEFIITDDLLPSSDDTYNLGSSTLRWQDLYLGPQSMHIGADGDESTVTFDTANDSLIFQNVTDNTSGFKFMDADGGISILNIDTLNERIGIGTDVPDEELHVAGDMRLDGTFEDKDGEAGTLGQILSSTATGTDWIDNASNPVPFISSVGPVPTPTNNTATYTIQGYNFIPTSAVSISGGNTVNSVNVLSPTEIEVNVTTTAVAGNYDIVISNNGILNTEWTNNGVGIFMVNDANGTTQANAGESCKAILDDGFSTGDGTYWINPNGGSTSDAFQVYCDMTTDGGGWTRLEYTNDLPHQNQFNGDPDTSRWLDNDFTLNLTDTQINDIRAVSTEGKQTYVGSCDGVIHYEYNGGYAYAFGFRYHTGHETAFEQQTYPSTNITVTADGCSSNNNSSTDTIFEIDDVRVPVINVHSRDNGAGEEFGSLLTSNHAWLR